MKLTRTPTREWLELTEEERIQRIRAGAVLDYRTLPPELVADIEAMARRDHSNTSAA